MKKSTQGFINQLSKKDIVLLTTLVNETIAFGVVEKQEKVFTAADMWNIHKMVKTRSMRRYF